jgi:hypothetical protein
MAVKLTRKGDTITVTDADLVSGGDPGTTYMLQLMTRHDYRELVRKNTTRKPNPRTRGMEDVTDMEALGDDLVDFVLQGWSGVVDDDGADAPCTRENKLLIDAGRTQAMQERAGVSQVQTGDEGRAESFRSASDVR